MCALPVHGIWGTRQNTDPARKLVDTHALRWLILANYCHASLPSHGEYPSRPGCQMVGRGRPGALYSVWLQRPVDRRNKGWEARSQGMFRPRWGPHSVVLASRPARARRTPRSLQAQGSTGRVTSCPPSSSRSGVRVIPYEAQPALCPHRQQTAALVAIPDEVQSRSFGSVCRTDDVDVERRACILGERSLVQAL